MGFISRQISLQNGYEVEGRSKTYHYLSTLKLPLEVRKHNNNKREKKRRKREREGGREGWRERKERKTGNEIEGHSKRCGYFGIAGGKTQQKAEHVKTKQKQEEKKNLDFRFYLSLITSVFFKDI